MDGLLVIFDCDGTLVDSEPIANRVLAEEVTALGWPMTGPESEAIFRGGTMAGVVETVERRLGRPVPGGWLEAYDERREQAFRRELRPIAGAAAAVDGVRAAGHAVCVASQGGVAKIRLSLELCGLLDRFAPDRLFSADDVAEGKPAPDLFLHAAATCGFPPARCVVVEDTLTGVAAAGAAGMRVFGLGLAVAGAEPLERLADLPARLER